MLRCRAGKIWIQLSDDSLHSASFTLFTLRKSTAHHDCVEPEEKNARVKRWRIVLEYFDEVAAAKESEPAGPEGWWKGDSARLVYWGVGGKADKGQKRVDVYFSGTLGKRSDPAEEDSR